jgi:hypothetical protein
MTDLGMRVLRYDLKNNRQLPDLVTYPGGEEYMRKLTTGFAKPCRSLAGVPVYSA